MAFILNQVPSKSVPMTPLNCGQEESLICTIFVFEVIKLKCEFIICELRSWILKPPVVILLAIVLDLEVKDSFVHLILPKL